MCWRRSRGFTIIELVITVAIIGLLATVALPMTELSVKRSKEQELRYALRQIRTAIDEYKKAGDEGRIPRAADASGYPPSLEILVEGVVNPADPKRQRVYFLRRIPRDPFHQDTGQTAAATWGKRSYESSASSPQPGRDVYDVFTLSTGVGFNGVPYSEW